ncbi:MAG: hypothetical protein GX455_03555 [Phycisphaerae bacterium]|nr:hypothetical protein [Phycisphaerae bacterium]
MEKKKSNSDVKRIIQKFLTSNNAFECLTWLSESKTQKRTLGEDTNPKDSVALITSLYDAGARKVWVFDIDDYGPEGQNSGKLIIELPDDPSQRLRILTICGDIAHRLGYEPENDTNQEAIFIMLD